MKNSQGAILVLEMDQRPTRIREILSGPDSIIHLYRIGLDNDQEFIVRELPFDIQVGSFLGRYGSDPATVDGFLFRGACGEAQAKHESEEQDSHSGITFGRTKH
jgi:hypothetical protein